MPSMNQRRDLIEALASSPPPIPLRNPWRDIPRYQAAPRYHPVSDDIIEDSKSSFTAQSAFEEFDRTPRNTQQRAANNGPRVGGPDAKMDRRNCKVYYDPLPLRDEDKISLASTSSSLTNGLKRYSSLLNLNKANTSTVHQDDERARKQGEIEQAMARIQSSLDMSDALTSIPSYDGAPINWPIVEVEEDDSRIEAWLQRGSIDTPLPKPGHALQPGEPQGFATTKRPPPLTIFPLTSHATARSEHATPLSPMNNGRDAYGNYIPTNARDYITTQPFPATSVPRYIAEEAPRLKHKQMSRPNLRGGGGWWNTLGFEKEPLVTNPPSPLGIRGARHSISVPSLKSKFSMSNLNHTPGNLGGYGRHPHKPESTSGKNLQTTNGRTIAEVDDDWSDGPEPELDIIDTYEYGRLRRTEPSTGGQSGDPQYGVRDDSKIPIPLSPKPHPPTQDPREYEHLIGPPLNDQRSKYFDASTRTVGEHYSIRRRPPFAATQRAESSRSDITLSPRMHKKWNTGPATGPPMDPAMPPPVPPKDTKPLSEVASSLGTYSVLKVRYERPNSPVESYDNHAWELQSLQLGESVSVARQSPRRDSGEAIGMQPPSNLSSEEFKAAQLRAQIEFRPLCQDIMIRYRAELSKLNRALVLDHISLEQYDMQMKWNTDNKDKALKYSADQAGYVILSDESDILDALTTPDGFAIYLDMLKSTNPTLWQKLSERHHAARSTDKPRGSSFDQACQVAGKIARFMLASPSDPDLKTHSMRRPSNASHVSGNSLMMAGLMDPINVAAAGGVINNEAWRTRRRTQEREKYAHEHERSDTRDSFTRPLPGPPSRMSGTTSAAPHSNSDNNGTSRITGTTAVPGDFISRSHTAPNRPPERPVRHDSYPPLEVPLRRDSHLAPEQPGTVRRTTTTTASEVSMWPEGDSQGNWYDVVRPKLRGGAGKKEKKVKKKKVKEPSTSAMYGEAMHFLK